MCKIPFFLAAFILPPLIAQVKAPQAAPTPEPIPLTQVAIRGEELALTLRNISRRLPANSELKEFGDKLREQGQLVRKSVKESAEPLTENLTLMEIRERLRDWRAYGVTEAQQRRVLEAWGVDCEESLALLREHRAVWEVTLKNTRDLPEFRNVAARIRTALRDIDKVKADAERQLRIVLDLQAQLSKDSLAVAEVVEKLAAARKTVQAHLLEPDAPPIWEAARGPRDPWRSVLNQLLEGLRTAAIVFFNQIKLVAGGLILLAAVLFLAIRWLIRAIPASGSSDEVMHQVSQILRRPVSLALVIGSPFVFLSYPLARASSVLFLAQLFLLPIVRLLPMFTSARRLVYSFAAFLALNGLVGSLNLDRQMRREALAVIFALAICILLGWVWRARSSFRKTPDHSARREVLFTRWSLAMLVVILALNVFGFLPLGQLLRLITLLGACFALVLYTLVRVTDTIFTALLRLPAISSLAVIRMHKPAVVRWVGRLVRLVCFSCWLYATVYMLDIGGAVFSSIAAVLNKSTGIRGLDFSIGDVIAFLGVLICGYLLASGLRFVLREEVLPYWRLARGLPDTISSSVYYVALLLVFFMSLSAAGIELGKLTVLTGAVGVGLGFGLQNIVNNFVSGLILQFERPIRVGDVLEVGELSGEIKRIGIRASTLRTWQGAEVIIPNSTFISGQVINWTLTEPRRRVDIPVHVAYGTDPDQVIRMLLEIAASHAEILRDPEPSAVFLGFGESSLDFQLMFWAEQATHFRLRSEVSIHINSALRAAGIDIPFPQRDLHVHSEEAGAFFRRSA
jgi:small-conductance mechanosensitive channel